MDILVVEKRWDEIVKLITPLDLVLFTGKDFVSSTIRNLQNKKLGIKDFSHVGIVVTSFVLPHIKELDPDKIYVWESTSSLRLPGFENEVPDVFGKNKLGVQIRDLEKVCKGYNGDIYIGKLIKNPLYSNYRLNINVPNSPKKVVENKAFDINTSGELQKIFAELDQSTKNIEPKEIVTEFDKIIEDMNKEISILEEMIDVSGTEMIQKIQETVKEIDSNVDEMIRMNKEILDEIDEMCLYINRIVYSKSTKSPSYKRVVKEIRTIYEIYGNKFYNGSALDLLSALYPILRPFRNLKYKIIKGISKVLKSKKIEANAVFCSQFVAIIYSRLGIIDDKIDAKNFVPVDFLGCDEDGQKNIVSNIFKIKI